MFAGNTKSAAADRDYETLHKENQMILVCQNCEGKEFQVLSDWCGMDCNWLAICQSCGAIYGLDHYKEHARVVFMPPSRPTDGETFFRKDVCT